MPIQRGTAGGHLRNQFCRSGEVAVGIFVRPAATFRKQA
jgi:hypothetical protein